jgi:membrane associated rhomboid family serine protease
LILVNGVVFLLQWIIGPSMVTLLGLSPVRVLQNLWLWQVTTYMFLHANILHLLFNMYVLWTFGRAIEERWGAWPFLWYYMLCGWGAAVFNVLFSPQTLTPSIGASGAIYGVLVAFAILFPETVLYLYFLIPIRAKHAVMLFAAIEFMVGFSGAASGVANLAHLGGMVTGFFYLKSSFLTRWAENRLSRLKESSAAKKNRKPGLDFHELSQEVDRILEKILREGIDSLTPEEQELMRRYSKMKK